MIIRFKRIIAFSLALALASSTTVTSAHAGWHDWVFGLQMFMTSSFSAPCADCDGDSKLPLWKKLAMVAVVFGGVGCYWWHAHKKSVSTELKKQSESGDANISKGLEPLKSTQDELASHGQKQKIKTLDALILKLKDVEQGAGKKIADWKPDFTDDIDSELLNKTFPAIAKNKFNTNEILLKLLILANNELKANELRWYGGLAQRILLILRIIDDALTAFGDQRDQLFTHVEFGEQGGLQAYLVVAGLQEVGFKNIALQTVTAPSDIETLNNRTCAIAQKLKINAQAFEVQNYLKAAKNREKIKNGSYAMVYPVWRLNQKFFQGNMAMDYLLAILQTFDSNFYLSASSPSSLNVSPLIYILLAGNKPTMRYRLSFQDLDSQLLYDKKEGQTIVLDEVKKSVLTD